MKKLVKQGVVFYLSLLFALGLFLLPKISFVWGSTAYFFTAAGISLPLLGAFGFWGAMVALLLVKLLGLALLGATGLFFLGVPLFFAAMSWRNFFYKSDFFARIFFEIFVPLFCFALFVAHPSGRGAFLYGLYWFIPVILSVMQNFSFVRSKIGNSSLSWKMIPLNIFSVALKSTFLAHAVGSVFWCYTMPMTSKMWLSLIPIVAVERLVFASGMVLFYYVSSFVLKKVLRFVAKKQIISI